MDPGTVVHTQYHAKGFNFAAKEKFAVSVYQNVADSQAGDARPLTKGFLVTGSSAWADDHDLNADPAAADKTAMAMTMPMDSNTSALATEYPNSGGLVEGKDRRKRAIMKGWRDGWMDARERASKERSHGK